MNKIKIAFILIVIVAVVVLTGLSYYINKASTKTIITNVEEIEKAAEPENPFFDTNDNLDQAIEDLQVIDSL